MAKKTSQVDIEEANIDVTPNLSREDAARFSYNREVNNVEEKTHVNCLRNEKIYVRPIFRDNPNITNKKHVLAGGIAETAHQIFTVPVNKHNGTYVNVLTKEEMIFLEDIQGLTRNSMSVYAQNNNYWDNYLISIDKQGLILDLTDPVDYIKYKVLLANTTYICPSLEKYNKTPKVTYRFVLTNPHEDSANSKKRLDAAINATILLSKYINNYKVLLFAISNILGRPQSSGTNINWIQNTIYEHIRTNPKKVVEVLEDPYIETKVFIIDCVEKGWILKKSNLYYLAKDSLPMCGNGENSTLNVAAKWLNLPENNEILQELQAANKE